MSTHGTIWKTSLKKERNSFLFVNVSAKQTENKVTHFSLRSLFFVYFYLLLLLLSFHFVFALLDFLFANICFSPLESVQCRFLSCSTLLVCHPAPTHPFQCFVPERRNACLPLRTFLWTSYKTTELFFITISSSC